METVGDRVRRIREAKGVTRKQLAHQVGLSYTGLASLEAGKAKSTTRLHDLASALDVSAHYLATGNASPRRRSADDAVSQSVRLDVEIVRDVAIALEEVFSEELHETYSLREKPELFVEMYERVVAQEAGFHSQANVVWLGRMIEREAQQGAHSGKGPDNQHQGHAAGHAGPHKAKG